MSMPYGLNLSRWAGGGGENEGEGGLNSLLGVQIQGLDTFDRFETAC